MSNPWRVGDSDSEDELNNTYDQYVPFSPKPPPVPKHLARLSQPKILDWDPEDNDRIHKKRLGYNKTTPIFERAPSSHKPIFSGPPSLKSSMSSLTERNERNKSAISNRISNITTPPVNNSNFDPLSLIYKNLNEFIRTIIPEDYSGFIHCCLRREKVGLQKGLSPTFYLQFKRPQDGKKTFLLAAQKFVKSNLHIEYTITTQIESVSEKSYGEGYVGKLRGNTITATEYTLYDNGVSPAKYKNKYTDKKYTLRREFASIVYNTNLFGLQGPRQMSVFIPCVTCVIQPKKNEDTILDQWRKGQLSNLIHLRNQTPKYIKEDKANMLQYSGNVIPQSSVKNFRLLFGTQNNEEKVVMQFARINDHEFSLDYCYPLSAIQAFAIALSSFDSRPTRE